MGFDPLSTNNFNAAGYWQEAAPVPRIRRIRYGNLTFSFYDDFAGTTLSCAGTPPAPWGTTL